MPLILQKTEDLFESVKYSAFLKCINIKHQTGILEPEFHLQTKMSIDDEVSAEKVISPSALAHVVLRTTNVDPMVDFWVAFLGASIVHRNKVMAFLRYDHEHHRIAIIQAPGTTAHSPMAAGMHHVAFSFNTLQDLVKAYKQRKMLSILPVWCTNHGPTTSMYYEDPDGNKIETQVDNFDTVEEAMEFMSGPLFAENPIGSDFDPEELVRRVDSGEDEKSIKKRIETGPRAPR